MTTQYDVSEILEKISKLASLADPKNGATQAEAELAAKMMQKLLDKYNLSMDQVKPVSSQTVSDVTRQAVRREGSRIFEWELDLISACCYSTGCDFVYWSDMIHFIGLPNDVKLTVELYKQFRAIAQHMATKATKDYADQFLNPRFLTGTASLKTYRLSYLSGFAAGLHAAFKEAKAKDQQSTALVVVKDQLIKQYTDATYKFGPAKSYNSKTNREAERRGYSDGKSANRRTLEG